MIPTDQRELRRFRDNGAWCSFAAAALTGLVANAGQPQGMLEAPTSDPELARYAAQMADALLAEMLSPSPRNSTDG